MNAVTILFLVQALHETTQLTGELRQNIGEKQLRRCVDGHECSDSVLDGHMPLLLRLFKFRETHGGVPPQSFNAHMRDLKWTLLRMGVAHILGVAIIVYFRADIARLFAAHVWR